MQTRIRGHMVRVIAAGLCWSLTLSAFDTGHHRDMTWNALKREGFTEDAALTVILQNWLTDYYAVFDSPNYNLVGFPGQIGTQLVYLHFDNLPSSVEIKHYWAALVNATAYQIWTRLDAKNPDPLEILTILGISLHAVQDFYSHSRWVEAIPDAGPGAYNVVTWFDYQNAGSTSIDSELETGIWPDNPATAGRNHADLNHDSYSRPRWDKAYVAAYVASRQWIRGFQQFVENIKPGFWANCVKGARPKYDPIPDLDTGLGFSFVLSELAVPGHWKGPSNLPTIEAKAKALSLARAFNSDQLAFKDAFEQRQLYFGLSYDVHNDPPLFNLPDTVAPPQFASLPLDERVVVLHCPLAIPISDPPPATWELYTNIAFHSGAGATAMDQYFRDNLRYNMPVDSNAPYPWTTMQFVRTATQKIDITWELWQEGALTPSDDLRYAINGGSGTLSFSYFPATGTCSGDATSCTQANPILPSGSGDNAARASIWLETRTLARVLP